MQVQVERVEYHAGQTIAEAWGTDVETDESIRFAGDWRPMLAIAEALDMGEEPIAEVPDWAVLR